MTTVPNRQALHALYDEAVNQINDGRRHDDPSSVNLTTGFYAETGAAVFEAGMRALTDSCSTGRERVHTVPAPVGAGKTSYSYALMLALTRYAERHPEGPYGCAFVCDQIPKADEAFRDLSALMPGKVAIWTGDHDKKRPKGEKIAEPAAQFLQDDLKHYPVIVVTHQFFGGTNGHKARKVIRDIDGIEQNRALFIIDERPSSEVDSYELTFGQVQTIKNALCEKRPDLRSRWEALWDLLSDYETGHDGNTLRRPSVDHGDDEIGERLGWFKSGEADAVFREHARDIGDLNQFFGLARAMLEGNTYVAPTPAVVYFLGWHSKPLAHPGTMLLDATADVDGVSRICSWRERVPVPKATYANLQIVLVPQHTKKNLRRYLDNEDNQKAYVEHMLSVIRAHMKPGERGLVVCKQTLFKFKRVPSWELRNAKLKSPATDTDPYVWDLDGRKLCAVHWGIGVGSNAWKTADVVFLFDEFYIPRRTAVTRVQGYRGHRADEGALKEMTTLRSKEKAVDIIIDGHRVSQTKQMALRGRARAYDEHGTCGKQRLVISCNTKRFLEYKDLLFPGAPNPIMAKGTQKRAEGEKVLDFLSSVEAHVSVVSTKVLKDSLGKPWRGVSSNVLSEAFHSALGGAGWRYDPGLGRNGSRFVRAIGALRDAEEPVVHDLDVNT